jgi:transcriptional repressor NrdR
MVVKRTGQREVFNREKLTQGVLRACEKTSVTEDQIQELVNQLESELQCQTVREVSSAEIGEMVLEQLRSLNQVAYIRFASVYSQFQNVQDFVAILDKMQASPPGQLATISTEI